jgi:hypothetical protein
MRLYALLALAVAASAHAQSRVTVVTDLGTIFRYNTDTIWSERDTSMTRTVYRGDTVTTERWRVDRRLSLTRHVVIGDSARLLVAIDSNGAPQTTETRMLPARFLSMNREMLASQLNRPELPRGYTSPTDVPLSPASPMTYCIDGSRVIIQHGDTARDVRTARGRTDTTVYVFDKDTTVRRLSPAPRTFGYVMYNTLVGEMKTSLVRKSSATRYAATYRKLPGKNYDACNPG